MQQMAISQFKAQCLAVLEKVRRSGQPLLVTKFGEPMAEINPPPAPKRGAWMGALRGTATIKKDLIAPVGVDDWEVLKK